jgi:phage FluMu gp28-like protein
VVSRPIKTTPFTSTQVIARRRIKFAEQDRLLDEAVKRYRVGKIAIDQTGMGEKPVEDAKRRYGEYMVDGVLMNLPVKLHLATIIKQEFQDRKCRIPMGDRDVRSDLHAVRKIVTPAGNATFDAERTEQGHADRFWAKALAVLAKGGGYQPYAYYAATPGAIARENSMFGDDDDDQDYRTVRTSAGWRSR